MRVTKSLLIRQKKHVPLAASQYVSGYLRSMKLLSFLVTLRRDAGNCYPHEFEALLSWVPKVKKPGRLWLAFLGDQVEVFAAKTRDKKILSSLEEIPEADVLDLEDVRARVGTVQIERYRSITQKQLVCVSRERLTAWQAAQLLSLYGKQGSLIYDEVSSVMLRHFYHLGISREDLAQLYGFIRMSDSRNGYYNLITAHLCGNLPHLSSPIKIEEFSKVRFARPDEVYPVLFRVKR